MLPEQILNEQETIENQFAAATSEKPHLRKPPVVKTAKTAI